MNAMLRLQTYACNCAYDNRFQKAYDIIPNFYWIEVCINTENKDKFYHISEYNHV